MVSNFANYIWEILSLKTFEHNWRIIWFFLLLKKASNKQAKEPKMYKKKNNLLIENKQQKEISSNNNKMIYFKQTTITMLDNKNFLLCLSSLAMALVAALALIQNQAQALSLISEKCDPNKVGPDETTVKGGWQAEMFNGLSFRTCGKFCFSKQDMTFVGLTFWLNYWLLQINPY